MTASKNYLAIFGLLFGAMCWGVIWYPYRLMQEAGVSGVASSFYTYAIAVLIGMILFFKSRPNIASFSKSTLLLAVVAGWTNLSYVLAVIDGEVMRVMLLFYLSPIWTLILARLILGESTNLKGLLVIVIALAGAFTMLWQAGSLPLPQNTAEWLALSSGFGFSMTNVITRRSVHLSLASKSMAVWLGVMLMSLVFMPFQQLPFPSPEVFSLLNWLVMAGIAVLLVSATLLVQYGVTHMPANRASVIFLFELVVAAVASYYLVGEVMSLNEWIGGGLIVLAGVYASSLEA